MYIDGREVRVGRGPAVSAPAPATLTLLPALPSTAFSLGAPSISVAARGVSVCVCARTGGGKGRAVEGGAVGGRVDVRRRDGGREGRKTRGEKGSRWGHTESDTTEVT